MKITNILQARAQAYASIKGGAEYSNVYGTANFYSWGQGSIIKLELFNLPTLNNSIFTINFNKYPAPIIGIISNDGYAFVIFYTDKVTPKQAVKYSNILEIKNVTDETEHQSQYVSIAYGTIVES